MKDRGGLARWLASRKYRAEDMLLGFVLGLLVYILIFTWVYWKQISW